MANASGNIFVRALRGSVGDQFVIKVVRSGDTVVSNMPTFRSDRSFSEAQIDVQERFREATHYAKDVKTQAVYVEKAAHSDLTAYNIAVADWFHAPKVSEIDVADWRGEAGKTLRVKAIDDVQVVDVRVMICDTNGVVLEEGMASKDVGDWWTYTTLQATPEATRVVATARDLPGHATSFEWSA